MKKYINIDDLVSILDRDLETGDEMVSISWVRSWLQVQTATDVEAETVQKMGAVILAEIEAALDSNYRALKSYADRPVEMKDFLRCVDGKIAALRGMSDFVEETIEKNAGGVEVSTIICFKSDCPYRSKRPLRKYRLKSGEVTYGCTLPVVALRGLYDPDGEVRAMFGYNPCECSAYTQYKYRTARPEEGSDENL